MKAKKAVIITLTADFGLRDGFPGVMKGVIPGINPEARIIDLSHEAALRLTPGDKVLLHPRNKK